MQLGFCGAARLQLGTCGTDRRLRLQLPPAAPHNPLTIVDWPVVQNKRRAERCAERRAAPCGRDAVRAAPCGAMRRLVVPCGAVWSHV
eukprot:gene10178-biopygen717